MNDRERKLRDEVETLKHDTKDTVDELKNRTQATGERAERELRGDDMSPGERLRSHVSEALHESKADIDKAKRDIRHGET